MSQIGKVYELVVHRPVNKNSKTKTKGFRLDISDWIFSTSFARAYVKSVIFTNKRLTLAFFECRGYSNNVNIIFPLLLNTSFGLIGYS